jgi:ABC-type nitrate/sulfonate/bicarbonate transport system substrate-binding protein
MMRPIWLLLSMSLVAVIAPVTGAGQNLPSESVTVGAIPGPPLQSLPFYVAQERGLFKAPDVNLEVKTVTSGAIDVLRAAIGSGQIDFGLFHVEHVLLITDRGQPTISVVQMMDYPTAALAVKRDLLPGLENEKNPTAILRALKGLKIGTVSAPSVDTIWFRNLAARAGLQAGKDYTFVHLGTTAQVYEAALRRGEVDVIFTTHPIVAPAIYNQSARLVAFQWEFPEFAPGKYAATSIITSPELLEKRRETVARFVKAINRAGKWMNENPDEYVKLGQKFYASWPRDYVEKSCQGIGGIPYSSRRRSRMS